MTQLIWTLTGHLQALITHSVSWQYLVLVQASQNIHFWILFTSTCTTSLFLRGSWSFSLFAESVFSFRICFTGAVEMSRKSPFASWLCAMLHCFGSYILADLLLGESPIDYFSNNSSVILATAVWWVFCTSPNLLSMRRRWLCTKPSGVKGGSLFVWHTCIVLLGLTGERSGVR